MLEEHPDTSKWPDAEARFYKVRKAYALLSDDGTRALLLEALEREVGSFEELSAGSESGAGPTGGVLRWALLLGLALGGGAALLRVRSPAPREPGAAAAADAAPPLPGG